MIAFPVLTQFSAEHINTLCLQYENALSEADIETIHDLRVACRRTLTLFQYFQFLYEDNSEAHESFSRQSKKIRKYLKKLNNLRDLHILMESLKGLNADEVNISPLLDYLKIREDAKRKKLSSEMASWAPQVTRKKVAALSRKHLLSNKVLELKTQLFLNHLTQQLHKSVGAATQLQTASACHNVRIRLKQYRYFLETMEQAYNLRQPLLIHIRSWQDQFGKLQDLDSVQNQLLRITEPELMEAVQYCIENATREHETALKHVCNKLPDLIFETQMR